jgi:DNA-binding winged helix-turn-helix (wHTH) protein
MTFSYEMKILMVFLKYAFKMTGEEKLVITVNRKGFNFNEKKRNSNVNAVLVNPPQCESLSNAHKFFNFVSFHINKKKNNHNI